MKIRAKEQAAAQVPSARTTDQSVAGINTPAPAAAPGRPRDDQLIAAVAMAFDTNADIARRWLIEAFASDRKAA